MAVNIRTGELKLIREADGLEFDLLPLQGLWTEEQYLRLTDQTNRFIEFTGGYVEVLPLPTRQHQAISRFLFLALLAFIQPLEGGTYVVHGVFRRGGTATSALLQGFTVPVEAVCDAE